MFFVNPPYTNASTYTTMVEVYNMRRDMAQSMDQAATLQRRVLRELRQLNRTLRGEERLQDITHALSALSQQLRELQSAVAHGEERRAARGERRAARGGRRGARTDSDSSVEVLHTRDCAPP